MVDVTERRFFCAFASFCLSRSISKRFVAASLLRFSESILALSGVIAATGLIGEMKELDINSCSASYLRQLLRKEGKSAENYEVKAERNVPESDTDSSEASSTVESATLKLAGNDAESIACAIINLAKLKGISLAEIATLLLAESAM